MTNPIATYRSVTTMHTLAALFPQPLRHTRHRVQVAIWAALFVSLGGCGGGGGGGSTAAPASVAAPTARVTALSTTTAAFGERVTITGENLNLVQRVTIGSTPVSLATGGTMASISFAAPNQRLSGNITLVASDGKETILPQTLQVYEPLAISALSAERSFKGRSITVSGVALDTVTSVRMAGVEKSIESKSHGALTFTVAGAIKEGAHPVEFATNFQKINGPTVTVLPTAFASGLSAINNGDSSFVRVAGSSLKGVSGVRVGSTLGSGLSTTDERLLFQVPLGTAGDVVLQTSTGQGDIVAGRLAVGDSADIKLSKLEFAQIYSYPEGDVRQRLTANKTSGFRVGVTSSKSGLPMESIVLTGVDAAGAKLGSISLKGPGTLPTSIDPSDHSSHYSGLIPSEMMKPGSNWTVSALVNGVTIAQSAKPAFGAPVAMDIVLIPVDHAGLKVEIPDPEVVRTTLSQVFPYAREQIRVTISSKPLPVADRTRLETLEGWSGILADLEARRREEAPKSYYYLMIPTFMKDVKYPASGIAYVNSSEYSMSIANMSGMGGDDFKEFIKPNLFMGGLRESRFLDVLLHELGHLHTLSHAPCGTDHPDPNYPHADGNVGKLVLHVVNNATSTDQYKTSDTADRDIMGYCESQFFSDYSYGKVMTWAEKLTAHLATKTSAFMASAETSGGDMPKLISGSITPKGLSLRPVKTATKKGLFPSAGRSDWKMTVKYADGTSIDYLVPVSATSVHAEGYFAFSVEVSGHSDVNHIIMTRNGVVVPRVD